MMENDLLIERRKIIRELRNKGLLQDNWDNLEDSNYQTAKANFVFFRQK